jgi:hypothetical protein
MSNTNIKLPEPYKSSAKNKIIDNMFRHHRKGENIIAFLGMSNITTLFYLYLFNKYNTPCITFHEYSLDTSFRGHIGLIINNIKNMTQKQNKKYTQYLTEIANTIVSCVKKGINPIIIPVSLLFDTFAHANILVIRTSNNTIEHFEPYGFSHGLLEKSYINIYLNKFVEILNKEFKQNDLHKVKLIESYNVCPVNILGLQERDEASRLEVNPVEPIGYCAAWSLYFTELVLKNPELTSKQLYSIITTDAKLNNDFYRTMIRGYIHMINDKIKKYFKPIFGEHVDIDYLIKLSNEQGPENDIFDICLEYLLYLEMKHLSYGYINFEEEETELKYEYSLNLQQAAEDYPVNFEPVKKHLQKLHQAKLKVLSTFDTLHMINPKSSASASASERTSVSSNKSIKTRKRTFANRSSQSISSQGSKKQKRFSSNKKTPVKALSENNKPTNKYIDFFTRHTL